MLNRVSAAVKARRRRHDPPKPRKKPVAIEEQTECDSPPPSEIAFRDFRASSYLSFPTLVRDASEEPIIGSVASPTPEERIACDALADLANGGHRTDTTSHSADSKSPTLLSARYVCSRNFSSQLISYPRFSTCTTFTDTKISAARLPPGVAPLTRTQVISVRDTGTVGHLTRVQSAQMRVAIINRSPPLPPTQEQRSRWAQPPPPGFDRAEAMDEARFDALYDWRHRVAKLFCEEDERGDGCEDDFILPGEHLVNHQGFILMMLQALRLSSSPN